MVVTSICSSDTVGDETGEPAADAELDFIPKIWLMLSTSFPVASRLALRNLARALDV